MRKSIFFKVALLIVPLVLTYEVAQLYITYFSIYNATLDSETKITQSTAETAASIFMFYNPDDPDSAENFSNQFSDLCRLWSVTYVYAEEIDLEARSEKYLAIGFGDDASDYVKSIRHPGVVVQGFLNDAQLKVSRGEEESMVSHQKTLLDDTLICFRRIDTLFDIESGEKIKLEKPILIGAEITFSSVMKRLLSQFNGTAVYDLIFTFLFTLAIFVVLYFRVNGPIRKISERMKNFVHDRNTGVEKLVVKGNDELVFLYTDGVNEAENTSGMLFGTETLENKLREHIGLHDENVSGDILKTITEFSDGAVQSDDITILTLKVKHGCLHREVTVKNHTENLTMLNDMINSEKDISDEIKAQLLLSAEELFVNICSYAYGGNEGDITIALDSDGETITLTFTDSGTPFDPTADVIDIDDYDHENSVGGLGRFLAFELSDGYSYSYLDGKNVLKIIKNL